MLVPVVFAAALSFSASYGLPQSQQVPLIAQDPFTLPLGPADTPERRSEIKYTRQNFCYGPDIAGHGPYYPVGSVADQMIEVMNRSFFDEQLPWNVEVAADAIKAGQAVSKGAFANLSDYNQLYEGQWNISIPDGPFEGILANQSSDLLFAMERLSTQPYSVRRLLASDELSFFVEDVTAINLTTMTQAELLSSGRLFYVDYRDQANQTLTPGRYAAASDAYFYIHPVSEDFLPLAIRPNNGSPLIYTPRDSCNDWTLAKMLFNQNDLWWAQWYHLMATHGLIDLVYEAAVRTMSPDHPVFGLMTRLAYETFAFRISAITNLINPGGPVDDVFAWDGSLAGVYTTDLYFTSGGHWKSNYLPTNFRDRGLINSTFGPPLKSIPFYSDASKIHTSIQTFITTFIISYYPTPSTLLADHELQNFVLEATPAKIIDFEESPLTSSSTLIDILTHFAYLVSVLHGVLNGNNPVHSTATLPMHPAAFYAPLPQEKGLEDIMPFMPNVTQSITQILLLGAFNRPFFAGGNKTLSQMFNEPGMLGRMNDETREANGLFRDEMKVFSQDVRSRGFDEDGLCQGMPFVWDVLDPEVTPFYLTV